MYFKQFYLGCLAHASYLIADEKSGTAVVVDPQRDVKQYLSEAKEVGCTISKVILSHFHADFVSGHLELRDQAGATICLGAKAEAEYQFKPLKDEEELTFGSVKLKILETPGHTPEAISIVVYDLDKSASAPYAVLTGDTLFIGDVGRPDLFAMKGLAKDELAGMLYDSIHKKLLALPDETLVYPAHGAGSMCGKNLSKETVSTIGVQRRINYALQPMSKESFVKLVTTDLPEAPKYFAYDADLNKRERATLETTLQDVLKPLSLSATLDLQSKGAQLLDVRNPTDYAPAHLASSINIGLNGQFAIWCGTLLNREKPIVIIADPGREEEAAMRLGRIGFDHIAGHLNKGMLALEQRPDLIRSVQRVTAQELSEELSSTCAPVVLDVRRPGEYQDKRLQGSINVPLNKLPERLGEIPKDQRIVIHCAGGYRSSIALSLLEANGWENVTDMIGGIAAWEAAQLKVESASASSLSCS